MTSQGAEDEITKVCEQEKKNLMLQQSESKKNLLVNFNQVHTYSEWFQFVMKWDFFELFWEKQSFVLKVFCTKGVLKNFAKFIRKHLCQSLFFNKVADLRPATLFKKRLWHRHFPVDFGKFLRTPIFTEHLQWLLLILTHFRSSRPEVFNKKGVLRNFAKFTGKHLC